MFALVLLTACAVLPEPQFEAAPAFVVANRVPTTHTYVYPTTAAPGYGTGISWAESAGVFAPYGSSCVGGSCSAPGSALMGIGAVRGLAGTNRPLFRPFRRR